MMGNLEKTEEAGRFSGKLIVCGAAEPSPFQSPSVVPGQAYQAYLHYVLVNVLRVSVHQVNLLAVNVLDDLGLQVCVLLGHHHGARETCPRRAELCGHRV